MRILLCAVGALSMLGGTAWAAPTGQTLSPADYQAKLLRLRETVVRCQAAETACDPSQIGADDRLPGFDVHWDWLRAALDQAKPNPKPARPEDAARRQDLLTASVARLDTMIREAGGEPDAEPPPVDLAKASARRDSILAQPEFRRVTEISPWDRLMARFWRAVGRIFSDMAGLGKDAFWLVPVIEWGFVLLCASGLLLWVFRVMQRQRLAIALDRPAPAGEWEEASRQWADAARRAADAGDWREAVHSLYWASVVELEGRKIWRQHRGRTPREYLRLLEPTSRYRQPIAALTATLERIWYGLRPAGQQDYARALALYEEVRAA